MLNRSSFNNLEIALTKANDLVSEINTKNLAMSRIKKYYAFNAISGFFILVLFLPTKILPDDNSYQWQIGEELTYKVEWQFIRLGTLKVQVCDTMKMDSVTVYHLKLFIDSNPTLFFVNMHSIFESYVDKDFRTHLFRSVENIDNKKYNTNYRFDYRDSLIYLQMTDVKDSHEWW